MDFIAASKEGFIRYFDFRTRSSRSEYWWFTLFVILVSIVAAIIDMTLFSVDADGDGPAGIIWSLATIIPGIALAVRRLHDINRSGWWYLLIFAIIIGWIVLLIWFCTEGTDGSNRFGEDPLGSWADTFD